MGTRERGAWNAHCQERTASDRRTRHSVLRCPFVDRSDRPCTRQSAFRPNGSCVAPVRQEPLRCGMVAAPGVHASRPHRSGVSNEISTLEVLHHGLLTAGNPACETIAAPGRAHLDLKGLLPWMLVRQEPLGRGRVAAPPMGMPPYIWRHLSQEPLGRGRVAAPAVFAGRTHRLLSDLQPGIMLRSDGVGVAELPCLFRER